MGLGMAVADFPNLFFMNGPNTNLKAGSALFFLECQANYIAEMIARLRAGKFSSVLVRRELVDTYNKVLQEKLKHSVEHSGCRSWYLNADGIVTSNWPGTMTNYWWSTRNPDNSAYTWC